MHLKSKKIKNYYEKVVVSEWIKKGLLSAILIITALLGIHISMKMVEPTIVFSTEIMNFLSYEEMGIAQGYILLPLIFLMGYSQFKNEFLLPKKFKTVEFLELWKNHLVSRLLILALILPLALLAYFIQPTGFFYVLIIIIATSSYQLYMSKQ